ncbi:sugar kinase [Candidatus Woesearchaeota archaeon]|nr:sugar kinase [Candidatus Woesearchaeota archaeon]
MDEEALYRKIRSLKGEFDILCIGELLTDYISREDKPLNEGVLFEKFFGGSPANIVFHMRNLDRKALLMTKIGDDEDGRFLLKTMKRQGMIHKHVKVEGSAGTTKSFIRKNMGTPDFEILRGADTQLREDEIDFSAIRKAKVVHSNAFSLAEDPARSTVIKVLKKASLLGKLISFDPNYRQKVWPDRKEALRVLKDVYSIVDLTKPSIDDAEEIFGRLKPKEYIGKFHELGAKVVVLTMGNKGSIISSGQKMWRIPVEQCRVVDATGAGDVYWAVFIMTLLDGGSLENAGRRASYAATKAVKRMGAVLEADDYEAIDAYMRIM